MMRFFLLVVAFVMLVKPSTGVPQLYEGHYYELSNMTANFSSALTAAGQQFYNGWQGNLATITTQGHSSRLLLMSAFSNCFFGRSGQPNDSGNEDCGCGTSEMIGGGEC
eukprot:m.42309 g.42309  ORF g.42309 m.42309 type:complete len:109 (-) comp46400_c0_seq1:126-452(-)